MKLATLCYIRESDKTLMLHRIKKENDIHKDKWNGLGGKLEQGESPEECLIREVKEESGLDVIDYRLAGFLTFPLFDGKHDWYVYLYEVNKVTGTIIDSPEGKLEWINNEDLFDLPLWEGDHKFIKWMFEGRFFSAKFIYKNSILIDSSVKFY